MREKKINFKSAIPILIIIFGVLQLAGYLGIGIQQSSSRLQIGYQESSSSQSWSANYLLWDGWKQRTIRPTTQPATLHITVQTDAGECSLRISTPNEETVFEKEDIQTSSFDVEVPGKVTVRITANHHKGGFSVEQTA